MKVSSKGHYGLLALAELVESYKLRRSVQVKEIAKNQHIPSEYLENPDQYLRDINQILGR